MVFFKFNWERFYSKIVSLHVKLPFKCIQTSRKEKFHKQSVVILLKNGCSVTYMFSAIFIPLSTTKVLEKHVRSSSYLVLVFFKENSYSHGKSTKWVFLLQLLYTKFSNRYFFELLFLVGDRKINKIYQRKLKFGNRLRALQINHWKLRLYGKSFCIRQNLQLSQFYRVSIADLCALLINIFEKLPLINSEINLRPPQHLKWSFCDSN